MATGYTHPVKDGEVTTLREFALRCARAFGALVHMRDEALDAPIPDTFEESGYYAEQIERAEKLLSKLRGMTTREIEIAAEVDYRIAANNHDAFLVRHALETKRFKKMLTKVRAWTPPTVEHENLKNFMIEQLVGSIEFGNITLEAPKRLAPGDWHAKKIRMTEESLLYSRKNRAEDRARNAERAKWVKELRDSLPKEKTPIDSTRKELPRGR